MTVSFSQAPGGVKRVVADFSAAYRSATIARLGQEVFDLVVIGGGITGCGIALDAVSRGLSVALLEQHDIASGTSSRSTKLIHGGLRYLKQLEFKLVKEVGRERAIVHRLAPHLVIPEKMLLPLYHGRGMSRWLTSVGLKIYDVLAGVPKRDRRIMLSGQQILDMEPLLSENGIRGGALYAEYRTDDARLTIELAKTAAARGALIMNYATATGFVQDRHTLHGVHVRDSLTGEEWVVRGKVCVNAAGPWVDDLRRTDNSLNGKRLCLSKGVHVVVSRARLPVRQAIYFDTDDGRMIFAIPRGRTTYIGTTDSPFQQAKDHVVATLQDAQYLLDATNKAFPGLSLTLADVESSWAGLRPLIYQAGKSVSALSRKDEIFHSPTGLISVAGGKLTGYRKMAQRVVDFVVKKHFPDRSLKKCQTADLRLAGSSFRSHDEVLSYKSGIVSALRMQGIADVSATQLVENFGDQTNEILRIFFASPMADPERRLILAQLEFCVKQELVCTAADFFVRRTGLLFFDISKVVRYAEAVVEFLAAWFGWSEIRARDETGELQKLIFDARIAGDSENG